MPRKVDFLGGTAPKLPRVIKVALLTRDSYKVQL